MLLYSAFWKVNKSSGEAERPEVRQYYLCQLIYGCKCKKTCNLRNARRNWRCFPMRGCSKGREHSSIILQTKALIIEEGNAAATFLALHVRHAASSSNSPASNSTLRHLFPAEMTTLPAVCPHLPSRSSASLISKQKRCVSLRSARPFSWCDCAVSKLDAPVFICACLDFFFF